MNVIFFRRIFFILQTIIVLVIAFFSTYQTIYMHKNPISSNIIYIYSTYAFTSLFLYVCAWIIFISYESLTTHQFFFGSGLLAASLVTILLSNTRYFSPSLLEDQLALHTRIYSSTYIIMLFFFLFSALFVNSKKHPNDILLFLTTISISILAGKIGPFIYKKNDSELYIGGGQLFFYISIIMFIIITSIYLFGFSHSTMINNFALHQFLLLFLFFISLQVQLFFTPPIVITITTIILITSFVGYLQGHFLKML